MDHSGFDPALDRTIECSSRAPGEARRALATLPLDEGLLRDVQLVVSEIVTNSVRHSGSAEAIQLRAWPQSDGVKVEISDHGFGFEPGVSSADMAEEGGRGLVILDTLADRWGVTRDAATRVWFELSRRPAADRPAQAG